MCAPLAFALAALCLLLAPSLGQGHAGHAAATPSATPAASSSRLPMYQALYYAELTGESVIPPEGPICTEAAGQVVVFILNATFAVAEFNVTTVKDMSMVSEMLPRSECLSIVFMGGGGSLAPGLQYVQYIVPTGGTLHQPDPPFYRLTGPL